ncbi:hypothetical protein M6D81_02410 [Paenibacillus sp. J5C_2022]|uniref:hypothetical protein n=1 Tax=Paenibacillus sp. J5C2022 TaxID=2977129 RepID=UPI0021D3E216|nr:hypothetical protein [Paenibacillus sp. J5C2022]MCU6707550.1 hypothetical protein [Paenibacillus sp. J5C2022]
MKKAYAILGLDEGSSKEEVEKRYTTLLKRERSRTKEQRNESVTGKYQQQETDFKTITEAYRLILAYEDRKVTDAFNEKEYGKYKRFSGQAQKMDHFWRYYRFHTIGAIILIALIIYGINSYIDKREHEKFLASLPPVDLTISMMGTFMEPDTKEQTGPERDEYYNDRLGQSLLKSFPEWKRIEHSLVFVPQDEASQYAHLQKAIVTLMSEHPDIYIVDKFMFNWIGGQNVFLNLGDTPQLAEQLTDDTAMKLQAEGDAAAQIYGVDLKESQLADDLNMLYADLIVAVRANANNPEKALEFIETYLKTIP